jgi:hypothetical protein
VGRDRAQHRHVQEVEWQWLGGSGVKGGSGLTSGSGGVAVRGLDWGGPGGHFEWSEGYDWVFIERDSGSGWVAVA